MKNFFLILLLSIALLSVLCSTKDVTGDEENIVQFLHATHYTESTECKGNYQELTFLDGHCYKNLTHSLLYKSADSTESDDDENEDGTQSFHVVFCDYEDDCECNNNYTINYESCYPEQNKEESQYYKKLEIDTLKKAYIHAKAYNDSTTCEGKYTDLLVIDETCYHFEDSSARWETQDKNHFTAYQCDVNTDCDNCDKMEVLYDICLPDEDKGKSYKYTLVYDPAPRQAMALLLLAIQFLVLYLFK
ncbi:hypothetical protein M0813_24887 [Anaeramoeba flamelloides]|uniref:Uncharacterized protein n=1 Tax=Anaeramoeba flamelloides TaxID=1746091 RepID=A0ABQ8Y4X5_9EUKA|nr:hypothetical protein M0813_24887 [Anaeramoeba flamelloides]